MEISPEQRQAISDNCLPSSWQMLRSWRLRHQGTATDAPDVVVDWLENATPRSRALVQEMARNMSERLWRIALRPASADTAHHGLRALDVVCGGQCWTLWLQAQPQLQLQRITR